jgi:hypothetical protein
MKELFELQITIKGPKRTYDSQYGPRTERDTLARLEVPVAGRRAWKIYQDAVAESVAPDCAIQDKS